MANKIGWCDFTWNPISGCNPVSKGCEHCYARRMAKRLRGRCGYARHDPFHPTLHRNHLNDPCKWKKPKRVFVGSMGDLFYKTPDDYLNKIWDAMWECQRHTFMILTKRPKHMFDWVRHNAYKMNFTWCAGAKEEMDIYREVGAMYPGQIMHRDDFFYRNRCGWNSENDHCDCVDTCGYTDTTDSQENCEHGRRLCFEWNCPVSNDCPHKEDIIRDWGEDSGVDYDEEGYSTDYCQLIQMHFRPRNAFSENVWLGVSVERQKYLDRIKWLMLTPSTVRFVSFEPLLGPINVSKYIHPHNESCGKTVSCTGYMHPNHCHCRVNWVIVGCETGPGARECKVEWVEDIVRQCRGAGVPVFVKKLGRGKELPEHLKIREFPIRIKGYAKTV